MAEILIAEDEKNVREGLEDLFVGAGYAVRSVADGEAVVKACAKRRPDLLLLDVMMPEKDGFAALTELRRKDPTLPIIMVTACGDQVDKIKGLGLGADDYVTKPFDVEELLARVARALARVMALNEGPAEHARTKPDSACADGDAPFPFAKGLVDPLRLQLTGIQIAPISLTPREVGILRLLVRHPGEPLGRDHLLGTLWGVGYAGSTRTLDQHIAQLRKKLGRQAGCIETISGVGYRYTPSRVG